MTERAAHLVDAVLRVYTRVLLDRYARGARERGSEGGQTGMVTALQRAGSGLNVYSGIGSWGARCLSRGDYVMGVGPKDGAAAAGGRSC
jgi:hypothetical protein